MSATVQSVAATATPVSLALYTDVYCKEPSTLNANVTLALDTCAVTPGLGSLILPDVSCGDTDVQVYCFSDSACDTQVDIFDAGFGCEGPPNPGHYSSIMLSCDQDEPGTPTATTTIDVGVPSSTSSSAASSSTAVSALSGWDSFSTAGKIGTIGGGAGGLIVVLIIIGTLLKVLRIFHPAPTQARPATAVQKNSARYETEAQRQMRYAGYGIAMNNMNAGGGGC